MPSPTFKHWCLAAIACGLTAAAVCLPVFDRHFVLFTPDAIAYVNSAENLLAGRGLVHVAWDCSTPPVVPLTLWPPGYPLSIAALSRVTGLEPASAALWISRAAWTLLPLGSVLVFGAIGRAGVGLAAGVLVQLSPGALFGPMALTDAPFLFLAMLVLTCWGRAVVVVRRAVLWALLAGLAAGIAYSFRNVGVALLVAVPVVAALSAMLQKDWRRQARLVAAFIAGAAGPVAALKLRSLLAFGTLEPYRMPPSTVPLRENILNGIGALVRNMTAAGEPSERLLVGNRWALAFITIPIGLVAVALILRLLRRSLGQQGRAQMILTLAAYVGCGMAVVIIGRTMYQWGEHVNPRYAFQYTWIVFGLTAAGALDAITSLPRLRSITPALKAAAVIGFVLLLGLHLRPWFLSSPTDALGLRAFADAALRDAIAPRTASHLILSDRSWLINQMPGCGRHAYFVQLDTSTLPSAMAAVPEPAKEGRPVLVVMFKGLTKDWEKKAAEATGSGTWRVLADTGSAVVLESGESKALLGGRSVNPSGPAHALPSSGVIEVPQCIDGRTTLKSQNVRVFHLCGQCPSLTLGFPQASLRSETNRP